MSLVRREAVRLPLWRAVLAGSLAPGLLLGSLCWAQDTGQLLEEWRITPRLSVGATYSDNIRLAPADEAEGDLV